jgi:Cu2+-exporting ATPase
MLMRSLAKTMSASPESFAGKGVAQATEAHPCCFHCGLPVPPGTVLSVAIDGVARPMCCPGCAAVSQAIVDGGLTDYYRFRTEHASRGEDVVPDRLREARLYDNPAVQKSFVCTGEDGVREASLILEGIVCAACVWLNERHLRSLPGVLDVQINYSTHRARVRWDPARIRLSEILEAISTIGYLAHPYDPSRQQQLLERQRGQQLRRLGVAGVLGMQVMMVSVALYAGAGSGMEAQYRDLFRWVNLLLTLPVLLYSARPFFVSAFRDLRGLRVGMDGPVSLGIALAFGGSLWSTLTESGHVYYDSVVMFVFFLLLGRYFELGARRRSAEAAESLARLSPPSATRLADTESGWREELVPVAELTAGDRVLIRPGESIPADGRVVEGVSCVDESLLTGEHLPLPKAKGAGLVGGSVNRDSPLQMEVERTGPGTVLSQMLRLLERAQTEKPAITKMADRAAAVFAAVLLALAAGVAAYWWNASEELWLPITISVLVVTCPCALSLATPTAVTAATGSLTRHGILVTRGHALETLARATRFVFDKTGTLTEGGLQLEEVIPLSDLPPRRCLALAAALERHSEHPIARALCEAAVGPVVDARDVLNRPGEGLRGRVGDREWFLGTADFVGAVTGRVAGIEEGRIRSGRTLVYLAERAGIHCVFALRDRVRDGAAEAVTALRRQGREISLLSGDQEGAVREVAAELGIADVGWGLRPAEKLDRIEALQKSGEVVAMVGDGVNDAPVLAKAHVSIAMGSGAQVARASADMVLLGEYLMALSTAVATARKTLRIIRQNLAWAIVYNVLVLPAAAFGLVAPWMAAIGMSASSLLVVLNATRLAERNAGLSGKE